jgi:flagellar motility protein MotE (MotC chaperone)
VAVASADEQIYALHENDKRPNPLFDSGGARRKLSATDPGQAALRTKWCELYLAALKAGKEPQQPASGQPAPTIPSSRQPVAIPVVACPKTAEFTNKVEDATADQTEQIGKAHLRATEMIDCSLKRLKAAKNASDPLVKQYFGISGTGADDQKNLDKLIANFEKIKKGMGTAKYEVENEKIKPGEPYTVAYVYSLPLIHGIGHVHVCYPAFSLGTDDERAATLVHEMSHYAVGTDDKAYEWQTQKWNKMSQKDQMDNADSYGGFAQSACAGQ